MVGSNETPERDEALLAEVHRLLAADRQRTRERIDDLAENVTSIVEASRSSNADDEHDPEGATIAFERSQASALLASARAHLDDVDAALEKITAGSYGRCERCGELIDRERLLVRPASRTCVGCAATRP